MGHFQMGILKNVFHRVQKPLRLERMFLGLKTYTDVHTNDFMRVLSTVSALPCSTEEERSIQVKFPGTKHMPLQSSQSSL